PPGVAVCQLSRVSIETIIPCGITEGLLVTFAEKLRELRTAAGLSEAKLAKLSGMSFGAVHNYGLGNRRPTFAAVVKSARALGMTSEAFAGSDDLVDEPPPAQAEKKPAKKPRKRKEK